MIDKRKFKKKLKDKYSFANETFFHTAKAHLKDRIEVEIGDSKQPDFKPQFKVMRWDNEVNFSMRAVEHPQATVETEGEKIKYITPDYEVHQYDRPEVSEDGGFEFEWFLPKKPESNVLTATIQTKGLDFFYQPALTPEEIAGGAFRPENVVGSYAVYHKEKGILNEFNGKDYKVGKAFHIYRPEAVDAQGNKTWCELNIDIDGGLVRVTVPQQFLDSAVYPVVVDPTFGYTSIGGTGSNNTSINYTGPFTGAAGDITSISYYGKLFSGSGNYYRAAVYSDSSSLPNSLLAESGTGVAINTTAQWRSTNVSYTISAVSYWFARYCEGQNSTMYYDTSAGKKWRGSGASGGGFPATASTSDFGSGYTFSIYATYTAGGGGPTYTLTAASGSFTETGIAAGTLVSRNIQVSNAAFSLSGVSTALNRGRLLSCSVGSFILSGVANNVTKGFALLAQVASYIMTGVSTGFNGQRYISITTTSFSLNGISTSLTKAVVMVASVGTYTITGVSNIISRGYSLTADTVSYIITGYSLLFGSNYDIVCTTGSFTLTGIVANTTKAFKLTASVVSFTLNGIATSLAKSYALSCTNASFVISGISNQLLRLYSFLASVGSYTITGVSLLFGAAYGVTCTVGSFSVNGVATSLARTLTLVSNVASFVITGISNGFVNSRVIQGAIGTFTLTGRNAVFNYSSPSLVGNIIFGIAL